MEEALFTGQQFAVLRLTRTLRPQHQKAQRGRLEKQNKCNQIVLLYQIKHYPAIARESIIFLQHKKVANIRDVGRFQWMKKCNNSFMMIQILFWKDV